MIGNLLYVTKFKLDVVQTVRHVAQFQATPKEQHVLAVKRIFIYLKGKKSLDYGIQKERIYHLFPTQMQIG